MCREAFTVSGYAVLLFDGVTLLSSQGAEHKIVVILVPHNTPFM